MNTQAVSLSGGRTRPGIAVAERRFGPELGHEPALDAFGSAEDVDRRGVSLRWLGASVLTAITGAALIGGAIYVAVQGETTFAELPEKVALSATRGGPGEDKAAAAKKGDKLVRSEVVAVAKQAFRAPMTLRAGDREMIKVRPFVRIATNLSLTSGLYAADIPAFNPLRLFAEENTSERLAAAAEPEVADAEVSVVKRDLASVTIEGTSPGLSDDDVAAQIEEERRAAAEAGRRPALPLPAQLILSRTLRQPDLPAEALGFAKAIDSPFNSIEVRVVPENVTTLPKIEPRLTESMFEERDVALKRNESFEAALKANGATETQIAGIVTALGGRARTGALVEGQRMRLLIGPGPRAGDRRQILRVILFGERGIEGIAAVNDRSGFVSVTIPTDDTQKAAGGPRETEDEGEEEGGVRLYESLYETAMKHELPRQTVEELVRIFGYDLDFQRRVSNGDSFEIFFAPGRGGGASRAPLCIAQRRRRGPPRLSLPGRRRLGRVLRRRRALSEEVPDAQAHDRGRAALRLRLPAPSDPRLHQDAHRRRLGEPHRHADHGGRQRHGAEVRVGLGLWPPHRGPAHQRLRHGLQPPLALRPRHRAGRARAPGPGDRLCRHRPGSRPARTSTTRSWSTAASSIR